MSLESHVRDVHSPDVPRMSPVGQVKIAMEEKGDRVLEWKSLRALVASTTEGEG